MKSFSLSRAREYVATSLWIAPGIATALAVAAAKALPAVDDQLVHDRVAWYLFSGQAASARELLSTIAASMMTFTGLVFSVTILVLQLASSQFSPRVLRTFLEDRATQVAMAVFIGTFVYAMALLPEVRVAGAAEGERVPALSVFVAFALVLVSVAVFIRYIHAMAHSIRAVHLVRRVARDAIPSIEETYPQGGGLEREAVPSPPLPEEPPTQIVRNEKEGGVVAAVDDDALLALACKHDAVIAVVPQHGDFVVPGGVLLRLWSAAPLDGRELCACIDLEEERTPHQDPAFALRQLVDVAERALSPGINDPTTAVQALDRIHELLALLATRRFPAGYRVDDAGRLRLVRRQPDWDALVRLGFDEIRYYGRTSIQVLRRLRAALLDLLESCPPSRRRVLEVELEELDALVAELRSPFDRAIAAKPSAQGHGSE